MVCLTAPFHSLIHRRIPFLQCPASRPVRQDRDCRNAEAPRSHAHDTVPSAPARASLELDRIALEAALDSQAGQAAEFLRPAAVRVRACSLPLARPPAKSNPPRRLLEPGYLRRHLRRRPMAL